MNQPAKAPQKAASKRRRAFVLLPDVNPTEGGYAVSYVLIPEHLLDQCETIVEWPATAKPFAIARIHGVISDLTQGDL